MGSECDMAAQTIADRYRVERPIGRGGMGVVWLARDQRLGRDVAVKQIGVLPGETAPDLARAMREARLAAVLNHPHVVSIYDVVEEQDHIWLVMEYVASRTLWEMITEDGPLSPEVAVGIGAQIADGLAAAHAVGTIHRDVKPGNILVTENQVAKITDFGIARAHDQGQLTTADMVIGTPEYFSPELARGEDPTPAVDVWALGATLYAAVEGHPPYPHQGNALALLAAIASTPPPRAESAGFLTEPIGRMLDPSRDSRWSMNEAAQVLHRLQDRHAREPSRQPTSELSAKRGGAGGRVLLTGLIGLLALAVLGAYLLFDDGSAHRPSATPLDKSSASQRAEHSTGNRSTGNGHKTRSSGSVSTTPKQTTTPPTSPTSTTGPAEGTQVPTGQSVTGASAQRFVRDYYSALPSNTQSAWSALSPGFQDKIGGYDNYQGFWSTISSVSVTRTTGAGSSAVDVSLRYTTDDGRVDREVRRIFVEREGSGYLIDGDAVVG